MIVASLNYLFEIRRAYDFFFAPLRPEPPGFFPPPSCLFTVAHARASASSAETPFFLIAFLDVVRFPFLFRRVLASPVFSFRHDIPP